MIPAAPPIAPNAVRAPRPRPSAVLPLWLVAPRPAAPTKYWIN